MSSKNFDKKNIKDKKKTIATVIMKLPRFENRFPQKQINEQKSSSQEENKNILHLIAECRQKQNKKISKTDAWCIWCMVLLYTLFNTLSVVLCSKQPKDELCEC